MSRWFSLAALCLVLMRSGLALAATRLAVLGDHDPAVERVTALLEPELTAEPGLQLVERDQLPAVLHEHELQAYFAADASGRRGALGRLLGADLLVLLRTSVGPEKHFDLIVCETRQGLRLIVEPFEIGKSPETDAAAIKSRVLAAVQRLRQPVTAIIAAPPLVCDDFSFAFASEGAAYARVIDQALLSRPGVLAVELAEARSITTELTLAGRPVIDRPLPHYLLGSFHRTDVADARRVSLQLSLRQGDRIIGTAARDGIEPGCVASVLREMTAAILDPLIGRPPAAANVHSEAGQLYDRGSLFLRLGQPEEALALFEASLLLQPRRAAHRDAARAIFVLWQRERDRLAPRVKGARAPAAEHLAWEQFSPLLRAGLAHVEAYMKAGPLKSLNDGVASPYLRAFPADEAGAMLLRTARAKYDGQVDDLTLSIARDLRWMSLPRLTDRYQLAAALAGAAVRAKDASGVIPLVFADIDSGKPSAELDAALDVLAASENPIVRQAARLMQDRLDRGLSVAGVPLPATERTESAIAATRPADPARTADAAGVLKVIPLKPGLDAVDGIMPAGDGVDALWCAADLSRPQLGSLLCLLKGSAAPEPVGQILFESVPTFDGRYLWAAGDGSRGPEVQIIDPTTGKVSTLAPRDGLPGEVIRAFAAAPLEPGTVCAAAQVEREGSRRTWIALLRFDPAKGAAFIPLYEGRLMRPAPGMDGLDPSVTFAPRDAMTLRPPGLWPMGPAASVAFRAGGAYYTVSFPDAKALDSGIGTAVHHEPPLTQPQASSDEGWDFHGGRLYWIAPRRGSSNTAELRSVAPGEAPRALASGLPAGALAVTDAGTYLFAPTVESLFRAAAPGQPFIRHPTLLPPDLKKGRREFARSNRYGLILLIGGTAYRFEDADGNFLPWKRP